MTKALNRQASGITEEQVKTARLGWMRRLLIYCCLAVHEALSRSRLLNQDRTGWIIGEDGGGCHQENGYWFFRYCREHYPDLEVYFVISETSPYFRGELLTDELVVKYGSRAHIQAFLRSGTCFYTHTYRDVIFRRAFERYGSRFLKIYLHHGVLGFKQFNQFYRSAKNLMDIFIVGSELEQRFLVELEGVDAHRIQRTGYARYDALVRKVRDTRVQRQIVFMPTHRNYLKTDVEKREFVRHIAGFCGEEHFLNLLERTGYTLKIFLHKQFQPYSEDIPPNERGVHVVRMGEEAPIDIMADSALMITDYSSVCWDFLYIGRPVIFYRTDQDLYLQNRGSYVDLKSEAYGRVTSSEGELIAAVADSIADNCRLSETVARLRSELFPRLDAGNCERIFQAVIGHSNSGGGRRQDLSA